MGYADILKSDLEDYPDKSVSDYLNRIIKSAYKMSRLIEDLLAFSRSGRVEVNISEVNLSAMAKEIIQELTDIHFKKQYEINIQDSIITKADPALMRIVMTNLLGNALKYSQKSTNPAVSFGKEMIGGREVLFVSDNGVGFDMEEANHLFSPFIRLHDKNQFPGTGVGLSTVKRILDRHGGTIWFKSAPNQGTTFFFSVKG